jgi:hypothetical protein
MDRNIRPYLLLPALVAVVYICSCSGPKTVNRILEVTLSGGVKALVYEHQYYDTALLGLEVTRPGFDPEYYWISMSSDVAFDNLKLIAEVSNDRRLMWLRGSSKAVPKFEAAYDALTNKFYIPQGVAKSPAANPKVEMMSFEGAPFPQKPEGTTVIFDSAVREE